jgi:hypothetical protein
MQQPVFVTHQNIDFQQWDNCLATACNSRPYGFSNMLNAACSAQWHGIILGDYEAVMPLPFNHKILITKQLYQPTLLQQLGIFYKNRLAPNEIQAFLNVAKQHFKYGTIHLNSDNISENDSHLSDLFQNNVLTFRDNHTLNLHFTYENLHKNYNSGLRARLRQTQKNELKWNENVGFEDWLRIFRQYQLPKISDMSPLIFDEIGNIILKIPENSKFLGVNDKNGTLIGTAFVVYSPQRITILLNAASDTGRKLAATHFLIDSLIQKYANTATILDFEGSSIPSIAEFNRSFGAQNEPYPIFKNNSLPFVEKCLSLYNKIR